MVGGQKGMNILLGIYPMRIFTTILHPKISMSGDKCFVIMLQWGPVWRLQYLWDSCVKENGMLSQLKTLNHKRNQKEHVIHDLEVNNCHVNSLWAWCEMLILGDQNPVMVSCISSIIFVHNIALGLWPISWAMQIIVADAR